MSEASEYWSQTLYRRTLQLTLATELRNSALALANCGTLCRLSNCRTVHGLLFYRTINRLNSGMVHWLQHCRTVKWHWIWSALIALYRSGGQLAHMFGCWNPRGSQPSLWKCSVHARDLKYDSTIKHQTVVQEEQMQLWHLQKTVNGKGGGISKKSLWTGTDCLQSLWQPGAGLFQVLAHPPSCSPTYLPSPSLLINLTYNNKVHQSHNLQVNPLKVAVEHLHFTYASLSCQRSSSTYKL